MCVFFGLPSAIDFLGIGLENHSFLFAHLTVNIYSAATAPAHAHAAHRYTHQNENIEPPFTFHAIPLCMGQNTQHGTYNTCDHMQM